MKYALLIYPEPGSHEALDPAEYAPVNVPGAEQCATDLRTARDPPLVAQLCRGDAAPSREPMSGSDRDQQWIVGQMFHHDATRYRLRLTTECCRGTSSIAWPRATAAH
ncbi:hypothetical protein NONO_c47270 [Nocardia nova SH22a]|uniref:Uncharacterized protein n=1 Tax=Nocardia nova SH22a TaxID=1415166 RepID=W5TQJ7_9NOCA|nr:hypothetical protein [Nocardia nova]AHH19511.1 hypothetical protein NONO_c47270 [Nocardia nova SH22a]